ncbi:choice-of-anchor A family protein [Bifidobacterium sp. SO1]|nr:choice-of-anchor A family protein [Bifidobacterium sp. SO1]
MLVGTAVAGAITAPYAAYAENGSSTLSDGALCTPTEQSMGTDLDATKDRDTGAATWVGGNMYVGKKPSTWVDANGPDGSYAVEAEGLTVVNGKLMMNPLKNSWSGAGFRFGVAGFGTQFRPANGSTALAVGGNTSDTALPTWTNVQAWTHSGFLRDYSHIASIAGDVSKRWGQNSVDSLYKENNNSAVVNWNVSDPLENVKVNTKDDASTTTKNFSEEKFYEDYVVEDIATPLSKQTATGKAEVSESTTSTLTRNKYNADKYDTDKTRWTFKYDDSTKTGVGEGIDNGTQYVNREKLITFTGTNNPSLEVFTIDSSMLSNMYDGKMYRGVAFEFKNINKNASIVINVSGTDVKFHTGWQFLWDINGNGTTTDISNGYSGKASTEVQKAYATAAQKILWNFYEADNVTIYGGVANEAGKNNDGNNQNDGTRYTEDDPSAAMLGSIIVDGNFESHVSTNGRVYTGGDFSMYNPYKAGYFYGDGSNQGGTDHGDNSWSSSVIDMDQERHNFPWNGSYTEACSAIAWNKSDENGNALSGTTWAVYGKYEDAVAGTNALYTAVKDNDFADKDQAGGAFKIEGLKPNATYFIKEVATGDNSYQLNTNIYYAATGDASDTAVKVTQSVTKDASGNLVFGDADIYTDQTDNTKKSIINKSAGHEVSWKKTAEGDSTYKPLAGSAWQIAAKDSTDKTKVWNVEDNVNAATSVTVAPESTTLDSTNGYKTELTATVNPAEAMQEVDWTFTYANGTPKTDESAAVLSQTSDLRADVIGTSDKDATVHVKACSVSNPDVCSSVVTITVKAANVTSFTVKDNGNNTVQNNASFTVAQNGSLDFTAAVTPSVPITWSSSNESVATVSTQSNGAKATVTMHALGSATITAKAGNKTVSFTVATPSTTVYFKKSLVGWSNYYLYYDDGTGGSWKFAKMDRTCGDYVAVTIPQTTNGKHFLLRDRNSTDGSDGWFKGNGGSDFTFTGNAVQVVEAYNNFQGSAAPSGCVAASAAADESVAAQSDNAADVEDTSVAVADSTTADESADGQSGDAKAVACVAKDGDGTNPGVKCDIDTVAGQFKVDGLDAGTYLIHELTAPDGYTLNKTVYQFTIADDGTVTWDGGYEWVDGQTSSTLTPGLAPTQESGYAISDKPTEVTWNKVDAKGGKLDGSQWKIVGPKNADGTANTAQKTYCVADNVTVSTDANGNVVTTPADTTFESCDGTKLSDSAATESGTITVKGLPVGEYALTETKAPNGYQLPENVTYKLKVVAEGTSTITKSNGSALTDSAIANSSKPVDIQIPVKKTLKYTDWPKAADDSFVKFTFQITKAESSPDDTPIPADCNGADGKLPCTIDLAPESGATDLQNVTKYFGMIKFTDDQLGDKSDNDYAKTYTYVITEVAPTSGAVENLRYSKAEWEVKVTVSRDKSDGKYQGLKVAYKVTQTKNDDGTALNGSAATGWYDSIGGSSKSSSAVRAENQNPGDAGTSAHANLTAETTFVNTKVLTGLPSTGTDWTGRMVLLAGAGFILAGMLIAGGYQFAKRREAVSA